MKKFKLSNRGMTLVEILVAMAVLGVVVVLFLTIQSQTWQKTISSNNLSKSCSIIEKQIEEMRIRIAQSPTTKFPPVDSTIYDNGIQVTWTVAPALNAKGVSATNVRNVTFTAKWSSIGIFQDSMVVQTAIALNF